MMMMEVTATDGKVGLTCGLFALCHHQTTTQRSQQSHLRDSREAMSLCCCKPHRGSTGVYSLKDAEV